MTTVSLPNGTQGTAYSFQFSANGGTLPYTWSLQSDTGSNTWNISSSGVLSGTPSNAETDTITAKVTDAVGGVALSAPLSLVVTASGGSPYVFKFFIAPVPIGNDANNGLFPSQGSGTNGPWTLGSLISTVSGNPTNQQKLNNAAMASQQVGVVGDQGPLNALSVMAAYPLKTGSGNVFDLPAGTAANPTVLASCNSSGQYVRGLAVIDGGATGAEYSAMNLIGRFAITAGATDAQYITIDGIEVKNAMNGGIVFGISAASGNCPGWVAKNCEVHHVYNSSQGFTATGCSMSNGTPGVAGNLLTIGAVTSGTVHFGVPGQDQLLTAPFPGVFISGFVSGTPGGAGVYSCTGTGNVVGPNNLSASAFAGSNTAGISFHGGSGHIQTNNYIHDIIDLNTFSPNNPNNQRVVGIKNWTCINGSATFNTIYATLATGYPTGGIEHKNTPQYDNTIANNYINLTNAVPDTAVDVLGIACDGDGPGTGHGIPAGSFYTINNNLIIANPNGDWGCPGVAGGFALPTWTLNWYNNTMIGVGSPGHGGFARVGPAGAAVQILNYHDNIVDRATPQSGGNGGDWSTTVNSVINIDFDLWPANYLLCTRPSGGGNVNAQYSASPPQNGGIAGLMTALTTASAGATTGLENNGGAGPEIGSPTYVTPGGLPAASYKLAIGSKGKGTGTGGSDKGCWSTGVTQIGCNFKDPSG